MTITVARPRGRFLGLRSQNPNGSVRLSLAAHAVLTIEPSAEGLSVCSPTGRLWLTQEGDGKDYLLEPGEFFRTRQAGRVVLQALEPSTFSVCQEGR